VALTGGSGEAGLGADVTLARLLHTLRWIPPRQLAALARERTRRTFERPERFAGRRAPPEPDLRAAPAPSVAHRARFDPEALRAGRFTFLNEERSVGWPPRWDDPEPARLWLYNLHYFEYLEALSYPEGRELLLDWIARHPLERGRVGWEPYPTSVRLLAWCDWLCGSQRARVLTDAELRARVWPSIWLQAEWLAAHLETHLRANHLLENAAALAFCGACFDGPGRDWLRAGVALLDRELPEQILGDGVHFERSPMYHARVLYVLERLAATGVPELVRRVAPARDAARAALARLCHPDGEIALLNDSAFGIAPPPSELGVVAPPDGPFALAQAGYYGARSGRHYVVCDAAPIGPDYNPGHAHGDLLSFELSLAGRRVLVDAGVHGYDGDPLRAWCRSTRAHNTVEIEGQDQSEFWGTFRVGRRARPRDVAWTPLVDGFRLSAWHDGYEHLPGSPRHARELRWYADGVLLVRDRVRARRPVRVASRLHLHPDCVLEEVASRSARVRHPEGELAIAFDGDGELAVEPSVYCPGFGRRIDGQALVWSARGEELAFGCGVVHGASRARYGVASGVEALGRSFPW
jgi:uncharacterized heparinase superfamily protein